MRSVLLAAGYVNVDVVAVVDRPPGFGERVTARSVRLSPGRMTANLACAAARSIAADREGFDGRSDTG